MLVERVDVILPTVGRHSLIRAVDSVLAQSVRTRAVIAVDEPSQIKAVRQMLGSRDRVVVLETPGRVGGGAARNVALSRTDAPVVAFLDDDDWWTEGSLIRRLEIAEEVKSAEGDFLVAGAFWHERGRGGLIVPRERPQSSRPSELAKFMVERRDLRFGRNAIQSSTIVVSGELARKVGWDESLQKHQDWDFVLRVVRTHSVGFGWSSEPIAHVMKDSRGSVSRRLNSSASLEFLARHPELSGRARADFLAVHVLRAALARRSLSGLRQYFSCGPGYPHLAALVVGGSGVLAFGKRKSGK